MKLTREQQDAIALFRDFRERDPKKLDVFDVEWPHAVAVLGNCEMIGYRTSHNRKTVLYTHDFEPGSQPLLCAGTGDNQLYLFGGRYRVTDRGIVDLDARLREILSSKHGKLYS